ncbi:hypothetical protein R1sor_012116 [Riccia sorocarpa]|uniref:Protein kinase domain-containing protein n=1 Tax=Riccia sorocarpa TaxID=122646 RepID=A0ABD3I2W4_9MARC
MATSSRGDKGKAPMVEQKDIGTEEGELLDVRPPLPEPVGRSGGDKKRKKPAREEEGPLAVALLPPTAEEKRAENARKKAEKEEKYRQNSIFRHRWFVWFTQETNNQTPLEKRFFTPGSLRGIQNFRSHLMELAIPPKSIKDHACTSAKYKVCESMSDNTIRFISKDSFTRRDETTRLGAGGAGRTHRVGVVDEELVPVLGAHDVVHYALKIWHLEEGNTRIHDKCIREMMAFPESHPAIIRPIGLSKDKKRPMLLFLLWNGCTLEKYINLEKRSRGRISPEGVRLSNEEFRATNVLLHFPSWDWDETKSRADSGRDNENRPVSLLIKRSMVFVRIGDLGWAQTFEEVQKDFDPYLVSDPNPRRWIAPELHPRLAIDDEDGNKYMTKFSQESDIYALGWLIREMCGDFFTDMTDEEKHEYNQAVNRRGLHIPNAAEVHGRVLKEGLEKMTWKKICHPYRNQRRTMDYCAHYFNEQLFIDPVTCARPIEYDPRAKVHPDGPQKVSKA